jgi:hypothetical protein
MQQQCDAAALRSTMMLQQRHEVAVWACGMNSVLYCSHCDADQLCGSVPALLLFSWAVWIVQAVFVYACVESLGSIGVCGGGLLCL